MSEESKLILDKSYVCPICDGKFKSKTVKTGVARFSDTGMDLRPIYKNINVTKYDVVSCNHCGYTAITRYFQTLTPVERMHIEQNIKANFTPQDEQICEDYTFDMAIRRYKLALLCAIKKDTKISEVGYCCLKLCWLYQDMAEALPEDDPETPALKEKYMSEAMVSSDKAYECLTKARTEEESPICGMDDTTFDYLLAALGYRAKDYGNAMRLLSSVSSRRGISDRLKNKAYDLKELISKENKAMKENGDGDEDSSTEVGTSNEDVTSTET